MFNISKILGLFSKETEVESDSEDVIIVKSSEEKRLERDREIERCRCPECGYRWNEPKFKDNEFKHFTCWECICDYKVRLR